MKSIVFLFAVLIGAQANAADVDLTVDNFRKRANGSLEIVIKFTNNTGRNADFIRATCAFLNSKMKAVTTENVIAQNVAPSSHGYAKAFVLQPDDAESADCRVTAVDFR